MLTRSQAFNAMPDADRRDIARNTALIADYLARPEGFAGHELPGGLGTATARALDDNTDHSAHEKDFDDHNKAVEAIGKSKFNAAAAHEGAAVAGELLNQVKFPTFVASLISGVFQSITHSSIEQMKAYQEMIAQVAKSLGQFADEHVTENQARDHMVGQFPDLFEIGMDDSGDTPSPRVQVRDGVDPDEASKTVRARLQMGDGDTFDLSDEASELAVVNRFKMQLAKQRQQMLASIVLMGINRIVVTDGKISAKIIYDVRAQDTLSKQRSATAVDLARDKDGNVQTTYAGKGTTTAAASTTPATTRTTAASTAPTTTRRATTSTRTSRSSPRRLPRPKPATRRCRPRSSCPARSTSTSRATTCRSTRWRRRR
ncbi:hypothetical protein LMA00_32170 [Burkholderia ambifaria]|uniref:hypothetical protein n=1 Tax=Burkholderia ambifaria TaxID=152480 RepID=UPI001E2A0072|nr:hypothetical protein [Burkholderia ambifaria]UEP52477.1 hypothetical protein LMA00_32170 [Burkholderia ambifaria]